MGLDPTGHHDVVGRIHHILGVCYGPSNHDDTSAADAYIGAKGLNCGGESAAANGQIMRHRSTLCTVRVNHARLASDATIVLNPAMAFEVKDRFLAEFSRVHITGMD